MARWRSVAGTTRLAAFHSTVPCSVGQDLRADDFGNVFGGDVVPLVQVGGHERVVDAEPAVNPRQRLLRRAAQFLGGEDEDPLPAEMGKELPQLQCVVADVADDGPTADGRQHVAPFGRPLHFPPIMADRPFDRVAEQVEDAGVGGEAGDPLGHPFIVRELGVVGRRLAAIDRVTGVGKQAAVPLLALGPVEPLDEIGGLFPRRRS